MSAYKLGRCTKEDTMLAPNPQAEALVCPAEETQETDDRFKKFVFVALLVVAYTIAAAAFAIPVFAVIFW